MACLLPKLVLVSHTDSSQQRMVFEVKGRANKALPGMLPSSDLFWERAFKKKKQAGGDSRTEQKEIQQTDGLPRESSVTETLGSVWVMP